MRPSTKTDQFNWQSHFRLTCFSRLSHLVLCQRLLVELHHLLRQMRWLQHFHILAEATQFPNQVNIGNQPQAYDSLFFGLLYHFKRFKERRGQEIIGLLRCEKQLDIFWQFSRRDGPSEC